ncbi:MAG: uracil phosphoribosyltransferase [Chloroflexi bacterium]|nr:uracil phosphoribosyltransferase [Chloroflexota bacterium]
MGQVYASRHPVVLEKLTELRAHDTSPPRFRALVHELSWLLAYEALTDARTVERPVTTPLARATGYGLADRVGLVPILRAGIGMAEAVLELLPSAPVWHLGMYRNEDTLEPVAYYNRLPPMPSVDLALVLDPMLATGGSAQAAITILKRWGVPRIKFLGLIAAPEGVEAITRDHPDVAIHLAAIDERLNEHGFIVPGLGDAGDRQFHTAG